MNTLPPPGDVRLFRAKTTEVRAMLREVLSHWSGRSPEELPLHETSAGPVWLGLLDGHSIDISLAHARGEGWIALRRGGPVGLDVMQVEEIPEAGALAEQFFGPALAERTSSPETFAGAWTELEARLKCARRGLGEMTLTEARATRKDIFHASLRTGQIMVTVAMGGRAGKIVL